MLFDDIPSELWIRFEDKISYEAKEEVLFKILSESDGRDNVVIFLNKERAKKILPASKCVNADSMLVEKLKQKFGDDNIILR